MTLSVLDCDLMTEIKRYYAEDVQVMEIIDELKKKPDSKKHFTWRQDTLRRKSKLVVPAVVTLKNKILEWLHGSSSSGHSGREATHQRVKSLFYWKRMILSDILLKQPEKILERKMVKRQGRAATQVLVKWVDQREEEAIWEFLFDLQKKYPSFEP
ncbi:hypothetical protein Bca52824_075383 [Brassica carinata]|uniref:Chromo domain-containing protein n=1 Tax=Brassica carinata TaxID=52824 RepID=A0A8X7PUY7_BRACI|nr:hypothetical protein Bca52824_075383 [Brassica carinata]